MSRKNEGTIHQNITFDDIVNTIIHNDQNQLKYFLALATPKILNNQNSEDGWSLLHIAVDHGNLEICSLILKSITAKDLINEEGIGAIHLAVLNKNREVYSLLIDNGCNDKSRTTKNFYNEANKLIPKNSSISDIMSITDQAFFTEAISGKQALAK
ncbi:MAG: ankyrin repeat domain-containing protein [Rickettsiales bacterium]|jgi:ankyrin repeat protein|nr:ankyrin repeat domain-containing protein [Rickettsiales bacterium]